ncbi:MAG: cysteine--tRNA ligase [Candidatus Falkowbacteria bacterium]|nr:cysteine--tRNA ligase [Candidatus Falkowbacteria bacterium]
MLQIYNTISRKKETFKPIHKKDVNLYYCGPTVYWVQHIGNLRGATCTDIIVRSLNYLGYQVQYVRNYTDVGHLTSDSDIGIDKMEKAAKREKLDPLDIAQKYINLYEKDTHDLNLLEPNVKPRATEHIDQIISMINTLIEKDFAYTSDLAIYFDVSKAKDYTHLSGQILKENITGAGTGEVKDEQKRSPYDFALWFFKAGTHSNTLQYWPSPFQSKLAKDGEGFPGWHIECSAMSKKHLGDTLDIHIGGIEHIPVHHTNEIAQSESANNVKFVNYWMHNEHLLVNNKKMSKSEGTGYSLSEIKEKGFAPIILRFFFLQAHYRSKLNFTWEALDAAQNSYNHLCKKIEALDISTVGEINDKFKDKFIKTIEDDFNTPKALAIIQELLKSNIQDNSKYATILDFDRLLGLNFNLIKPRDIDQATREQIESLIQERKIAREEKNWKKADEIRDELTKINILIEDKDDETYWRLN